MTTWSDDPQPRGAWSREDDDAVALMTRYQRAETAACLWFCLFCLSALGNVVLVLVLAGGPR